MKTKNKKIVTIGGGTGTYTILSGLKKYSDNIDLTAIVTVADSGGSTGRLRDEFGFLPVGDVRMALVALAKDDEVGDVLRRLFLYRFYKGKGLKGHNFGNLFLVAMTDIFNGEEKAIEEVSKILRIEGRVLPIANEKLTLIAKYEDGSIVVGEAKIDEPPKSHDGKQKIINISVEPDIDIAQHAKSAIKNADFIIMGPGDLYTSILANVVVSGASRVIKNSNAKIIYVTNLMTKYGQTNDFSTQNHVDEIVKYIGRAPDYIIVNNSILPKDIVKHYYEDDESVPVEDDFNKNDKRIIRGDFLAYKIFKKPSGDVLKRSLIRHDSDKLASAIMKIIST